MVNQLVQQEFIDNAPSEIRNDISAWFDVRNEALNRLDAVEGIDEMDGDAQREIYDRIRNEVIAESGLEI